MNKPTELDSMNALRVKAERKYHEARGALLWLLWHHQGASSVIGLACRKALGIGQYDHLTDSQIEDAKAWDAATPPTPASPATPLGGSQGERTAGVATCPTCGVAMHVLQTLSRGVEKLVCMQANCASHTAGVDLPDGGKTDAA